MIAKLFGIETEYGLSVEGHSPSEQVHDSINLVSQCQVDHWSGWDYANESPRHDLRGFTVESLSTDPNDATWDLSSTSPPHHNERNDKILVNGSRLYNDHGHPEYATPECTRILDLVAHDIAGENIVYDCCRLLESKIRRHVKVYKNNIDYYGSSYGTHENYLVPRTFQPKLLIEKLLPLLISRPLLVGAGKISPKNKNSLPFEISQRAEHLTEIASVDTLYRRPIFNTRDEPHADPKQWMRLHVICGDANRMQWANAMKFGMIQIVLDLIASEATPVWRLTNINHSLQSVSQQHEKFGKIELEGSSWTTGAHILESYLEAAEKHLKDKHPETDWVIDEWRTALCDLIDDPYRLSDRVDWVAKLKIFEAMAPIRHQDSTTLKAFDLAYSDISPETSLYTAWEMMGNTRTLVNKSRVRDSMFTAPQDTRAALRGEIVKKFSNRLLTLGWRRAVFDHGDETIQIDLPVVPTNWTSLVSDDFLGWLSQISEISRLQEHNQRSNA